LKLARQLKNPPGVNAEELRDALVAQELVPLVQRVVSHLSAYLDFSTEGQFAVGILPKLESFERSFISIPFITRFLYPAVRIYNVGFTLCETLERRPDVDGDLASLVTRLIVCVRSLRQR
jgi:hypothetical protein